MSKKIGSVFLPTGAKQRGSILVIALLALVVLSVLGLAFMTISKTESDISYNNGALGKALYIADAGLERFKRDLRYQFTYPGTDATWRYLASPAPAGDGTSGPDTTGVYVKSTAPVKRYYDLGAPLSSTFADLSVYLQNTLNGGSYGLKVKKDAYDDLIVRSVGMVGSRVARTIEVKYEAKSLSVWDNAIFGGTGASGALINGNVTIAGSVHILGNGLTSTDTAIDMGGGAKILNQYTGISSTLNGKLVQNALAIAAIPGKLRAEFRVKRGRTSISSNASGVGESTSNVRGVYTNDGFTGTHANQVYSDNGKNQKYDIPSDIAIPFPMPDTAWLNANSLDISGSLPASGGNYTLDSNTSSFSLQPDAHGNTISWNQGTGTLTLNGVFKVPGNLNLAKKNNIVLYSGKGTLYATGDVNIYDCVLPATASSYPSTNIIGIIAGNNMDMDSNVSQVRHCGAFYAQNSIIMAKQDQIAGTIVTNYFNLGSQVPSIYQVPLLSKNLPPGMPGGPPYIFIKTAYWKEVTN
jgi:Tfp pilus assembly protein PilX